MNDKEKSYYPLLTIGYGKSYTIKLLNEKDEKIEQLQSNWNSLREWLKEFKEYEESEFQTNAEFYITVEEILDKMNELEGRK